MLKPGWQFIDSKRRAETHPKTWAHPANELKSRIGERYYIKVGVERKDMQGPPGERFWAQVETVVGDSFVAKVNQDLLIDHGVEDGEIITVQFKHIFGILDPNGGSIWEAMTQRPRFRTATFGTNNNQFTN